MGRAEVDGEKNKRRMAKGRSTTSMDPFKVEWDVPEQICLEQRPDPPLVSIFDLLGEVLES